MVSLRLSHCHSASDTFMGRLCWRTRSRTVRRTSSSFSRSSVAVFRSSSDARRRMAFATFSGLQEPQRWHFFSATPQIGPPPVFLVLAQLGGGLPFFVGRPAEDGLRDVLGTTGAAALAFLLRHAADRRHDAKILTSLHLDDDGVADTEGIFGWPVEIFAPVAFEPDFEHGSQITSRSAHPWKGTFPRGV